MDGIDLTPFTDKPLPPECGRQRLLLRFLRARKFNADAAYTMLQADLAWRRGDCTTNASEGGGESDNGLGGPVSALNDITNGLEVLGCSREDFASVQEHFPMVLAGHDKQGRPVLYKKLGANCVVSEIAKRVPTPKLVQYHVWTQEHTLSAAARQSEAMGRHIERVVVVIDAKDWYVSLFSSAAREYLRGLADMDSAHYPERLGAVVIVNSPLLLSTAWAVIRVWLDDRTTKKVRMLRGPDDYEPVLRELIGDDQLLKEYGGKLDVPFNTGIFAAPPP